MNIFEKIDDWFYDNHRKIWDAFWIIKRPIYKLGDWRREVKWAWQRVFRQYDDPMVWGFCSGFNEVMPKILRQLAEKAYGCQWREVLIEMAEGFEAGIALDSMEYVKDTDEVYKEGEDQFFKAGDRKMEIDDKMRIKLEKQHKKALELFTKYFWNLWD